MGYGDAPTGARLRSIVNDHCHSRGNLLEEVWVDRSAPSRKAVERDCPNLSSIGCGVTIEAVSLPGSHKHFVCMVLEARLPRGEWHDHSRVEAIERHRIDD